MKQVARFLGKEPVDKQWPVDLIVHILSFHREEIAELRTKQKHDKETVQKQQQDGEIILKKKEDDVLKLRQNFFLLRDWIRTTPYYCRHKGQARYKKGTALPSVYRCN